MRRFLPPAVAAAVCLGLWFWPSSAEHGGVLGRLGYGRFMAALACTRLPALLIATAAVPTRFRRAAGQRLAMATVSVILSLGVFEVFCYARAPHHFMDNPWYVSAGPELDPEHPDLPFLRPPGLYWEGSSRGDLAMLNNEPDPYATNVVFRTDEDGFRNAPGAADADIVFVGDSFTEAGNVPESATFAVLTAARLGLTGRNLGLAGYTPPIELLVLKRFGMKIRPRAVVWQLAESNDLREAVRYREWLAHGRPTSPRADGAGLLTRAASWRLRSPTYRLFTALRRAPAWMLGPSGAYRDAAGRTHTVRFLHAPERGHPAAAHPGFADLRAAIVEGHALLRSNDVALVVCLLPMKFRVMAPVLTFEPLSAHMLESRGLAPPGWDIEETESLGHAVAELCRAEGISFADLTAELRRCAREGGLPYQPFDTHLSAAGHQVVSRNLAPLLERAMRETHRRDKP